MIVSVSHFGLQYLALSRGMASSKFKHVEKGHHPARDNDLPEPWSGQVDELPSSLMQFRPNLGMRFARTGLGFGRRWLRLSDGLGFLIVEAEAERGVAEGSGDADGNDLTFFLFLEK